MNILVVDDLPANRKLLRAQLEAEGISVVEAADGVEALEVLTREPLDAVISDILMPRMDGYRLCHEVRKDPTFRKLRFVLYSSTYTSPADVRLSKTIGADQFIAKPAPIGVILEALQISVDEETPHALVLPDDAFILKRYSEVLVAKLEEKNADLEKALAVSQRSHHRIQELNSDLERRVGERTLELLTANSELTQERNYAEATLRTARDPLIILRPDFTINTANDAFYRTFELTEVETENRLLFELADGTWNIPALRALLEDVLPRNHFFNDFEVTHHFGKLGLRTMLLNGRRLNSEEGAPLRILLSFEDITERLQSRALLRTSEIRYRRMFEAAKDGVLIIDPDTGRITDINPFMTQLLGCRPDECIGKELFEIGLFRDRPAAQDAFVQLREKHEIRYERLTLNGQDGVPHAVEVVANLYDEDGRIVIQCNVRDITERRRLEAALQTSEAYFRELTQSLPCGVWTSTPDGAVDFINQGWLTYTGRAFPPAVTHPEVWMNAIHPEDRSQAKQLSAAGDAAGGGYTLEARFQAATGEYRWFLNRSVPVRNANGVMQKRIGICIDIDDLKRAQNILADHAGELAAQVHARTGELRETIGELEAFSYSVSHDMRAPLRAMQGFAHLLLINNQKTLDPRSLDHLSRIRSSAARLDGLINDVLTYSRLLRSEIVLQPVNLDDLVRQVIATYPQLQAEGAEIVIENFLPAVLANEASLTQCVSNLLSNAVKFVAPGMSAKVRIRTDDIEGDVRLWIEDNGIGIDPVNHHRIWNIFTRIERANEYEGTGIGLAIVRKAVERMDGQIGLESALGEGSKFWLRLRKASP